MVELDHRRDQAEDALRAYYRNDAERYRRSAALATGNRPECGGGWVPGDPTGRKAAASGDDIEQSLLDAQHRAVERALREADDRTRNLAALRYKDGYKLRECAAMEGVSEVTTNIRLGKLRHAVRQNMNG